MDAISDSNIEPAIEIQNHELLRVIGRGTYGTVWLARNVHTRRLFAVKVILKDQNGAGARVVREAKAIISHQQRVLGHHDNLVTISNVGDNHRCFYYFMDLADDAAGRRVTEDLDGYQPDTLDLRMRRGTMDIALVVRIIAQMLQGLSCLHQAGLTHRDVKPSNCVFVGGVPKLADFGLLTDAGDNASLIGTPKYMPPDRKMGTGADIFAVGMILYELLTELPTLDFPRWPPDRRERLFDKVVSDLNRIMLKACEPDASKRYSNGSAMLAEIQPLVALDPPRPSARRQRIIPVIAGLVLAVAAIAFVASSSGDSRGSIDFISTPYEAIVLIDGEVLLRRDGEPYRTPCTVDDLALGTSLITFRLPGRADLNVGRVDLNVTHEVRAEWPP